MELDPAIQKLFSEKAHPIVFVAGLSGSGKTTFAKKLADQYPNTQVIALDWYLKHPSNERRKLVLEGAVSEDRWTWFDLDKFKSDVQTLQTEGRLTIRDAWDQKTGKKDLVINLDFGDQKGLVVCEGIYLLHPDVTALADVTVLMRVDPAHMLERADTRDSHRTDSEYAAWRAALREKYDIPYTERYKGNADIVLY